ncbi:MAG: CehA/McbA family metallohydrolase, partial [Oscillospiraceae bacterium]|nr:CehA/McbA family metallohydrolase [Oscillospiraceae bacterium]
MGSALNGKKVAGVTAADENGSIALTEEMARLQVTVDGEYYIFSLDGKYLTSAATGNGMSYAEELTDCGKWKLEQQEDGKFILMNVGANYNGNYNQAMEYYNGFTTYGVKTTDIYKMDFYLVERPTEGGRLTSADQFVSGTYVMVVEGGYAMGALDGTWVSVVQPEISGDQVTDAKGGIWTLTVSGSSVQITDANGASIKPKGGNNNGIASGSYDWAWSFDEATQTFTFAGTGSDTVKLASNASEDATYGGFHKFRGYKNTTISGKPSQYPCNFTLYAVVEEKVESKLPAEGEQVVIYNLDAQGVLAAESDTQSINNVPATIDDGIAYPDNGGVVFTVSKNGSYYRFYNETYGYLCSNGTGNNAFYTQELSEDADWTLLTGESGGFFMESRTAKYNGVYSQYLEYYADSYKTYSMYNVTNYDIYEFFFYPVTTDLRVTGGIVNEPAVNFTGDGNAYMGQDHTVTFEIDAVFGVHSLTVRVNETETAYTEANGIYTVVVSAEQIAESVNAGNDCFTVDVFGIDNNGLEFVGGIRIDIIDEPSIVNVSPAANSQTFDAKRPLIVATIVNAGENPIVTMTVNGEVVDATYVDGMLYWQSETDMADGRTTVTVTVTRADGKVAEKTWSFTVGVAQYELYFGQLHSHTTYSDGSGTLASALSYIQNLPESANVDFVAFTDHSNYFDTTGSANPEGALYDMSLASASSQELWNSYKTAVAEFNAKQNKVIAIGGFEMTWSGGPGHINTFATPGIVSRNNSTLNNKTADAGMKAYYALLSQTEGVNGISQLNHPGTTFGNFTDFAYWDAVIDSRVHLVEVGNGEGQVGAGGYYPSYEQYTMALDKGWHIAPTNNQDNHKGKWGNANDARDVVLTDDFSEEGIYEAIRNYRVYATEDKNLEIGYTVNGMLLGSIISEVPEKLSFQVTLFDPDSADSISKVEVIVNSGKVAYTWDDPADLADGLLTADLAPDYSYYYLRVTQGDGDIAVTAPVWVGEILKLGISSVECGTSTPVTGEELTISTTLFNSETTQANVKSLTYSVGSQVLAVDTTPYTIPASGNTTLTFKYTPDTAKVMKVTVTAVVELDGVEYTFSMDVTLDIQDASKLVYIGIDASHYNEYVNGNYKDSMGNFGNLAAGYSVRTVTLNTSEDLIAACANDKYVALILTAPSRRLAAAQSDPKVYTAEELAALKAFNAKGGTVILAGWSDNYENYDVILSNPSILHMAAAQNEVLKALGSSLRIGDDATYDDVRSKADGVDKWRLYFNTYGENFLTAGVEYDAEHPYDRMYTEVFSHYGGATIYAVDGNGTATATLPATVSPVVYAHASTYSVDVDKDGLGGSDIPKYTYAEGDDRLMVMAMEQLEGQGLIIVSGAAFMSNFEVQATIEDSGSEKNYSNYRICENLVSHLNPTVITDIAEVQAQVEEGVKYTIEGIITSNASGFDKDTAFFDCIYLQDATAGINAFPVAGNFKIGDKVRITGTTSSYQGERQIAVTEIELISEGNAVAPIEITASQLNDGSKLGSLVTLSGVVESFEYANGLVQTIMVKDAEGNVGRVFIDGYITTAYDVENLAVGAEITVTGLA